MQKYCGYQTVGTLWGLGPIYYKEDSVAFIEHVRTGVLVCEFLYNLQGLIDVMLSGYEYESGPGGDEFWK